MSRRKFDTQTDPRILMALALLERLDELTKMGKVPGIKKAEAMHILERLISTLNKIRESKMSKNELLFSGLFRAYNTMLSNYISAMGTRWYQIAKFKDDHNAKYLRFILLNLRSLGSRIKKTEDGSPLGALNIVYVRILEKKTLPRLKGNHLYRCTDLECVYEVGSEYSIDRNAVVAFVNTWPIKVGNIWSEGLFVRNKECADVLEGSPDYVGARVPFGEICPEDKKKLEEMIMDVMEDYMELI